MNLTPKQQFKRFTKVLIFVFLGIFICDQFVGRIMEYLYFKQKSGLLYRTTYSIEYTRASFLVLGSSRANHDYDPAVFEKNLNSSFYNCGRDKQGLLYSCAVLSGILQRYNPKYIIIDIRPDEFTQSDEGSLSTILPYAHNNAVGRYIKYNSRFENVKLISKIYPYNSLLTNLIVGLNKRWSDDYKGYVPLKDINTNTPIETLLEGTKADTTKIFVFRNLLSKLNDKHIQVLLTISPIRYKYLGLTTLNECISFSKLFKNTEFLNFTNQARWEDFRLYSDNNHLNSKGADLYSDLLSKYIKFKDKRVLNLSYTIQE